MKSRSLVKLSIETFLRTRNEEVGLKLLAQFLDQLKTLFKSFSRTAHAYMLPHDVSEFLVYGVDRAFSLDVHQPVYLCLYALLCLVKLRQVS